ncbi:MAG: TolC family protein [Rubrivivax sp.]|nr:TolC family protein [Rubrivivax sp.]
MLRLPGIDGGARQSRIGVAQARGEQAAINYEAVVLQALTETAAALDGYTRSAQQAEALLAAAEASQRAARLAQARFDAGASDVLVVLDAERERLAAADRLARAQTGQALALALLSVYQRTGRWLVTDPVSKSRLRHRPGG